MAPSFIELLKVANFCVYTCIDVGVYMFGCVRRCVCLYTYVDMALYACVRLCVCLCVCVLACY